MTHVESEMALLIPSCDAYADVWPPLFQAFEKYWPAAAFSKYLVTNQLAPRFENVQTIQVGQDVSWSDNLLSALQKIPEPYVLLNIDDLILCKPVDHAAVMSIASQLMASNGNYVRFNPTPSGRGRGAIGEVLPGDFYRASTVFSLWRKEVLQSVLRRGEDAWHFEIHGSARTDVFDKWFASRRPLLQHVNLVIKGKVDPRAVTVMQRCGIAYQSRRAVLSRSELIVRWLKEQRSQALVLLPRRLGRSIRNVFRPV